MTPARQAGGRVFRHTRVLRAVQIVNPSRLTRSLSIGLRQLMAAVRRATQISYCILALGEPQLSDGAFGNLGPRVVLPCRPPLAYDDDRTAGMVNDLLSH